MQPIKKIESLYAAELPKEAVPIEQLQNSMNESGGLSTDETSLNVSKRNRVPIEIYDAFQTFIENKKIPSIAEICPAYGLYPGLIKFNPEQIINLIKKAMDFDQSFNEKM